MKRLIVNADDFGLCSSVNRAVIECFRLGNITSATIMANMPGTSEATQLALANPRLDIGLHFCLTEGQPLTRGKTLGKGGHFWARSQLVVRSLARRIDLDEVRHELAAQLDSLQRAGLRLSHVDSHQHVHMIPGIFRAVAEVAAARGLRLRMVCPPNTQGLLPRRPLKFLKQLLLRRRSYRLRREVVSNDCLLSIHDLGNLRRVDESVYADLISAVGDGEAAELMVHPYILGDDLQRLYGREYARHLPFLKLCESEHRTLSARPIFSGNASIRLSTYADL